MSASASSLPKFEDLIHEAGLRSLVWNRASYLAGKYYHWIVAIFTTLILLTALIDRIGLLLTFGCIALYWAYFGVRKSMTPNIERQFYRRNIQFARAQIALVFIGALILVVPEAEQAYLWLLFVPIILLTSKHCITWQFLTLVAEASAFVPLARLVRGVLPVFDLQLVSAWLWLWLLSFILHYLMRNIQARTATIASYNAVNLLAARISLDEVGSAQQWQPLLTALVYHLNGGCAAVWLVDAKTQNLQRIAAVQRVETGEAAIIPWYGQSDPPRSLQTACLIAEVARTCQTGETQQPEAMSTRSICPQTAVELAIPIALNADTDSVVWGVLSLGFTARDYRKHLRPDYVLFMQSLVNQARPMLAYAQRLEELAALQEVGRRVSHGHNLTEVLDGILDTVVERLGFKFALISLIDEDRQVVKGVRGRNVSSAWLDMAEHGLKSNDIQAHVVRTGKTEVVAGWDDRLDRQIYGKFGHADLIRVFTPIIVADPATGTDRIIGTIEAGQDLTPNNTISREQLRMLEAFEQQVSMLIEHAQLLERTAHKAEALTSLHTVGQSIALARDLSRVLNEIGQQARILLNADIVMLYRYHRAAQKIDAPLVFGDVGPDFKPALGLQQDNVLTRLLHETQPYYSPDARQDELLVTPSQSGPLPRNRKTFIQMRNIRSFAGIPLIVKGDTLGVMFVNYRVRHQFDPDERQLHELFAQQAAVAIMNAESNDLAREKTIREERDHLARELHDSVSQALFGIHLKAQLLYDQLPSPETVYLESGKIADMAHTASQDIGFLVAELRAPLDEGRRLTNGIEQYVRRLRRWYDAPVRLEINACPLLPDEVEETLWRLAREALSNAVRHARASTITVRCEADEQQLTLSVHDDGRGFDLADIPEDHWGLHNMRELARQIAADLLIDSTCEHGTTITIQLPLHVEEEST